MFETDFSARFAGEGITPSLIADFQSFVFSYYTKAGRHDMQWRHTEDPYLIAVSEVMLQQTQVPRVAQIFPRFIEQFPNAAALDCFVGYLWKSCHFPPFLRCISSVYKNHFSTVGCLGKNSINSPL